jgi:NAD(P)-dependent dehydrogenase (short-subunit alcohol dehydrogenase family)
MPADVGSLAAGERLVELALSTWGRLDIVINNAGIGRPRMVFNMEEADWDEVIRVHLTGTFAVTRAACRRWHDAARAADGFTYGRLINTASGLLIAGGAGQSNYVAAKGGIAAFSEAVASEMAPYGVTVNVLMPAALTRFVRRRLADDAERVGAVRRHRPGARRRARVLPRQSGRRLDQRPDLPRPRRDDRARARVAERPHPAARGPAVDRRRAGARDAASVRRGSKPAAKPPPGWQRS